MRFYVLNDKQKPIVTASTREWAAWMAEKENWILKQDFFGIVLVSTVFLGLDMSFGFSNSPLLFETMIFGGKHDHYQKRCATYVEALEMHKAAHKIVKREIIKAIDA
jgi:hypothetical protein